jgi:hypothetical protein
VTVAELLEERGIEEVLHFTTNRGIVGILSQREVLSRRRLPREKLLEHIAYPNASTRPEEAWYFDKSEDWLDYVNLSLSEVNSRFLDVSNRWHADEDVWWVILSFEVSIVSHAGVWFATTNNGYPHCKRKRGREGLEALFESPIPRKGNWAAYRAQREPRLPTCEQAEVLYPKSVSTDYLRKVYVSQEEHISIVRGWLREFEYPDVQVVHSARKFAGRSN